MDLGLSDKVALVPGASSGLGLAIAHELAAEGASVAIVSRRQDALDRAAKAILERSRSRVLPIAGDVTKNEDVERVVREAARDLGPIDVLIANAGGPPSTLFATFFFQAEDGIRDLTVTGVQTCALPIFADQADQSTSQPPVQAAQQTPAQLQQLVAPIALYPDALVAQVLAASTYPDQIVEEIGRASCRERG